MARPVSRGDWKGLPEKASRRGRLERASRKGDWKGRAERAIEKGEPKGQTGNGEPKGRLERASRKGDWKGRAERATRNDEGASFRFALRCALRFALSVRSSFSSLFQFALSVRSFSSLFQFALSVRSFSSLFRFALFGSPFQRPLAESGPNRAQYFYLLLNVRPELRRIVQELLRRVGRHRTVGGQLRFCDHQVVLRLACHHATLGGG